MDGDGTMSEMRPGELGGKLAGLSLPRQVLALALWPFLQNLMGSAVGFADMMIAGRMELVGSVAAVLDMMGVSMYLMWLLMILQGAMGTGAMALVSRSTGARDMKSANLAMGQSIVLGLLTGVLSGVLIWFSVPWFGWLFSLGEEAQGFLVEYMRMAAWVAPFSGILFVASSCLRAYGDTMKPFMAMVVVNVVNVVASLYFVFGRGWGVEGLAMGTVLGWAVGSVLILFFLRPNFSLGRGVTAMRREEPLALRLADLRYDIPMMRRIWKVSWPSMFEVLGMWSVHAVGVYLIGSLSNGLIGAHALVVRLESISFMPGFAIGMAASTLTGQYLGAKNPEMAKRAIRYCWKVAVISMGVVGILTSIFNTELLSLFGKASMEQLETAAPVVRWVGFVQVLTATMMVMKMSMRGAGDTRTVTIYSFISMGLIRVVALWCLVKWVELDLLGIWIVLSIDALAQAAIFTWLHFRGKWAEKEV